MTRCLPLTMPAVLLFVMGTSACSSNDAPPRDTPSGDILTAEGIMVFDADSASDIVVLPDRLRIPTRTHPDVAQRKAGDILVGDRAANSGSTNETGFLRRIVSIAEQDEVFEVETDRAALTDAIRKGNVDISVSTSDATRVRKTDAQTRSLGPGLGTQTLTVDAFDLDGITVLDEDASVSLSAGAEVGYKLWARVERGAVDLGASVELAINLLPDGSVDSVKVVETNRLDSTLSVDVGIEFVRPLTSEELDVLVVNPIGKTATYKTPTLEFSLGTTTIGGVPVAVNAKTFTELTCELAFSSPAHVQIDTDLIADQSAGFRYANGSFFPVWDHVETLNGAEPTWTTAGGISARCAARPTLEVLLYDIPTASFWTDAYAVVDSHAKCEGGVLSSKLEGEAFSGVATSTAANAEIFGLQSVSSTCPLFDVQSVRRDVSGSWVGAGAVCSGAYDARPVGYDGPQISCFTDSACDPVLEPIPPAWTCTPEQWGDCRCDCNCGVDDVDCSVGQCAGCEHDACTIGTALGPSCTLDDQDGDCISAICTHDPYCCEHAWTLSCIDHVEKGDFGCVPRTCPEPELPECTASSCPDGCCQGTVCVTQSDEACGIGGQACQDCSATQKTCDVDKGQCMTPSTLQLDPGSVGIVYPTSQARYAYAPSTVRTGGLDQIWACANVQDGAIRDHILYMERDAGTVIQTSVALAPAASGWDSFHVCDPSVVAGAFGFDGIQYEYALFYTGNDKDASEHNAIGVALAHSLAGPWVRTGGPLIPFPVGASPNHWGVGQQSVTSVDGAGNVFLFYTRGDHTGTRVFRRLLDLSDMNAPIVGEPVAVTTSGLTTAEEEPDFFNNVDFAYHPLRDRFYIVREQRPQPTDAPDFITAQVQVASIEGSAIWNGGGTWCVEGSVNPTLSGWPRNHNAGLARSAHGTLADPDALSVLFTTSCGNCADSLFTYQLWEVRGSL